MSGLYRLANMTRGQEYPRQKRHFARSRYLSAPCVAGSKCPVSTALGTKRRGKGFV